MLRIIIGISLLIACSQARAQELYVSTEPASNMAAGSIGFRLNGKLYNMPGGSHAYRADPEIMFGISKKIMLHLNLYASNMYQPNFRVEGAGVYGKYRFFSSDDVHAHFRMAAFGKISFIDNPSVLQVNKKYFTPDGNGGVEEHNEILSYHGDEIDVDGNNSGLLTGIVATQLSGKMAFSSSVALADRWNNIHGSSDPGQSVTAVDYSLSGGYLLLPRVYRDYRQTNFNIYCEWLGSSALDKKAYYIDVAPAVQFIFNSISRLDLSYRTQVTGNMQRLSKNYFLLRFEYNLLNIFKNRS